MGLQPAGGGTTPTKPRCEATTVGAYGRFDSTTDAGARRRIASGYAADRARAEEKQRAAEEAQKAKKRAEADAIN